MFERLIQEHHRMTGEREEKEGKRRVKGGSCSSLSRREQMF